ADGPGAPAQRRLGHGVSERSLTPSLSVPRWRGWTACAQLDSQWPGGRSSVQRSISRRDTMAMTSLERAEAAEHAMSQELDRIVVKSAIYTSGERDPRQPLPPQQSQGKLYMMGHDPRLPLMPEKPT